MSIRNRMRRRHAVRWLKTFFDCEIKCFEGVGVPMDTESTVIAFPYNGEWRVRIAWMHKGQIHVTVNHCPSGEYTLNRDDFHCWEDAMSNIAEAVHGEGW